jgi:hypothetical protein
VGYKFVIDLMLALMSGLDSGRISLSSQARSAPLDCGLQVPRPQIGGGGRGNLPPVAGHCYDNRLYLAPELLS